MAVFLQFDCLTHNETAREAMENYIGVLQKAFDLHRNLWENYVKLQEKYEKRDVHLSPETDKLCREEEKELASQKQLNNYAIAQETDRPFSKLDTWNMSLNSDEETSFSSPSKSLHKITTNFSPPRSPVFSRTYQKTGGTSARKLNLRSFKAAASVHNNSSSDMKPHHSTKETTSTKCPKLEISTSHHVETTILSGGKKLKQSRLVFNPTRCNEKKVSLPYANKPASILPKTEKDSISNISVEKAILTSKNNVVSTNETIEDVIEISPTQRSVTSKVRHLKLKRKAPIKQATKCSPRKNNPSAVPEIIIDFAPCALPKYTSTQVKDDKENRKIKPTVNILENKVNTSDFASVKVHSESQVLINVKSIKTERESQSEINKAQNITQNTNNFANEDETFYLPAEQAANTNNRDDINLHDTENKPPVTKILLNKDIKRRKKDIPEQLNMRCKADRAKLSGWDCWECKQYYQNLSLSEEELQKRKNQCSRHRHRYDRPNTPEGFWDPEFPETLSSTYRQNQN
ncbi:uncharacterized protein [Linepithema humile]|uniref:uncharacterized protein n=1 Tax=Linepithema humile TaxID=83485 RepID=UPI0006231434|nr:PREDICTED: uncharacterized protein LOC105678593 [Linepithema humile]